MTIAGATGATGATDMQTQELLPPRHADVTR